jgi:hypothetical protein
MPARATGFRVLLIARDPERRRELLSLLREAGYLVTCGSDMHELIWGEFRRHRFALIVLDAPLNDEDANGYHQRSPRPAPLVVLRPAPTGHGDNPLPLGAFAATSSSLLDIAGQLAF